MVARPYTVVRRWMMTDDPRIQQFIAPNPVSSSSQEPPPPQETIVPMSSPSDVQVVEEPSSTVVDYTPKFVQQSNGSEYIRLVATKDGFSVCSVRLCSLTYAIFLLFLIGFCVSVPIIVSKILSDLIIITTTTTTTTTTQWTATPWIPANYYTQCLSTSLNISFVTQSSTIIASWPFEGNTYDTSSNGYSGIIINGAAFVQGYVGTAIQLSSSLEQYVNVSSYIPLTSLSFTVEVWIYINPLNPTGYLSILSQCDSSTIDQCLNYVVSNNSPYMGFYSDDLASTTSLSANSWYHIAFVYDYSNNKKSIYVNGLLDTGPTNSINAFLGNTGVATQIGWSSLFGNTSYSSGWSGRIDQLRITNTVKSQYQILNDASVVCYFPFDNDDTDDGPNHLTSTVQTGSSTAYTTSGRVNQALVLSTSSLFQVCGLWSLGQTNQPFSFAMWIKPNKTFGTLLHLSITRLGSGGWCFPMMGFSSNGSLIAQIWDGSASPPYVQGPVVPLTSWTHLVYTWSSTNGIQFYINGGLYAAKLATQFIAGQVPMCVTLGSMGASASCAVGQIDVGNYIGGVDEFYIFNRELTASEVCPLAHP